MKQLLLFVVSICMAFSCAACSFMPAPAPTQQPTLNLLPETTTPTQTTSPTQLEPTKIDLPLLAVALPVTTQTITAADGTPIFQHTFQNINIVCDDEKVVEAITQLLAEEINNAAEAANDVYIKAQEDYAAQQNWTPYLYHSSYSPMRFDRVILSLSGSHVIYDGNAHPYDARNSITYSMITGAPLTLQQVLDPSCTAKKLSTLITDALRVYGDTLFGDYPYIVEDCLRGLKGKIENWYLSDAGLCFYFAPYEIAPYSVGVVTAEIPYTQLLGVLSDDFFPPEAPEAAGEINLTPLKEVAPDRIQQYVEVIIDETQDAFVLDTNGSLLHVKIELGKLDSETFIKEATIFSAESLITGTGILLQIPMESDAAILKLTFDTSEAEKSYYIMPDVLGSTLRLIKN